MEIERMKSDLKMENLYFSKCLVERSTKVENGAYKADLHRSVNKTGEHLYDVELQLSIEKEDLSVLVIAKAQFLYEASDYTMEESIVKNNTVAIMFPYIRSQVTLLTTQPGITPILLPLINTTKYEER